MVALSAMSVAGDGIPPILRLPTVSSSCLTLRTT
jgi:hypothetical protein